MLHKPGDTKEIPSRISFYVSAMTPSQIGERTGAAVVSALVCAGKAVYRWAEQFRLDWTPPAHEAEDVQVIEASTTLNASGGVPGRRFPA